MEFKMADKTKRCFPNIVFYRISQNGEIIAKKLEDMLHGTLTIQSTCYITPSASQLCSIIIHHVVMVSQLFIIRS